MDEDFILFEVAFGTDYFSLNDLRFSPNVGSILRSTRSNESSGLCPRREFLRINSLITSRGKGKVPGGLLSYSYRSYFKTASLLFMSKCSIFFRISSLNDSTEASN